MKQPTDKEMLDWMERNSNKLLVKVENDQCVMFGYRDKVLPPSSEFNFPQWHYTDSKIIELLTNLTNKEK